MRRKRMYILTPRGNSGNSRRAFNRNEGEEMVFDDI